MGPRLPFLGTGTELELELKPDFGALVGGGFSPGGNPHACGSEPPRAGTTRGETCSEGLLDNTAFREPLQISVNSVWVHHKKHTKKLLRGERIVLAYLYSKEQT